MILCDIIAFDTRIITKCKLAFLVGLLGTGVATAQVAMPAAKPAPPMSGPTRYQPNRLSPHAIAYYAAVWALTPLL